MGRYGRPRLPDSQRREAGAICIRLNEAERKIVEEKAAQVGVTPHEWARHAALERDPPPRLIVPELNQEAWLQSAKLMATLNGAIWRFKDGQEGSLRAAVENVRNDLATIRTMLIGGQA